MVQNELQYYYLKMIINYTMPGTYMYAENFDEASPPLQLVVTKLINNVFIELSKGTYLEASMFALY